MREYRTEVIPFAPGVDGETSRVLNTFAREGWRLHSVAGIVPAQKSMLDQRQSLGMVVVLEREKAQSHDPIS